MPDHTEEERRRRKEQEEAARRRKRFAPTRPGARGGRVPPKRGTSKKKNGPG
jgi:hypothetical protein